MIKTMAGMLAATAMGLMCGCAPPSAGGSPYRLTAMSSATLEPDAAPPLEKHVRRPRVTVVGWMDASQIHPKSVAPNSSSTVRNMVGDLHRADVDQLAQLNCMSIMGQLWLASLAEIPATMLPFINEDTQAQDGLFVQAELLKATGNGKPPAIMTDEYINGGDYRLLNDFEIVDGADGSFARQARRRTAKVGLTPLPCAPSKLTTETVEWLSWMDADSHPAMHDRRLCDAELGRVVQVSQGRIGKTGRNIQRLLSVPTRSETERTSKRKKAPVDLTPWIFTAVIFEKNKPDGLLVKQNFPTYFVYIDGRLQPQRTAYQPSFVEFLRPARWEYLQKDFDAAGIDFDRGGCR
jgi:hypothetical protein